MDHNASHAAALYDEVVKSAVTSVLKPVGFRKTGLNFHRRLNDVVQVVNLQRSQGSTWNEKLFYVNVGLAFDAVCHLTSSTILEKPKESECDERGTRDRLENLIDNVPDRWAVSSDGDTNAVTSRLRTAITHLDAELQNIVSVQAYRNHRWFYRFRPKQENAQILYVLGELDAAWNEIRALCECFSDRQSINRPEWWIANLGLQGLSSRLAGPNA